MCSIILCHRPEHEWPLLLAANRDEMISRAARPPGRHWGDRPDVIAGYDAFAGGSWLGLNDHGVVAAILNRAGSLGPAPGRRSRGELVLEALDHADAMAAADAFSELNTDAYRPFNLVIADNRDVIWLRNRGDGGPLTIRPLQPGLHMITAFDLNDPACQRTTANLDRWRAASPPDPETGDWQDWQTLLLDRTGPDGGNHGAMFVASEGDYGTVSSALIALPAAVSVGWEPVWLYALGLPKPGFFAGIDL